METISFKNFDFVQEKLINHKNILKTLTETYDTDGINPDIKVHFIKKDSDFYDLLIKSNALNRRCVVQERNCELFIIDARHENIPSFVVVYSPSNTKLKTYDDRKERFQSVEVWVNKLDIERGYGADITEAVESYKANVEIEYNLIKEVFDDLLLSLYEIEEVDGRGEPIK